MTKCGSHAHPVAWSRHTDVLTGTTRMGMVILLSPLPDSAPSVCQACKLKSLRTQQEAASLIILISQIRQSQLREGRQLCQDHSARRRYHQGSNTEASSPRLTASPSPCSYNVACSFNSPKESPGRSSQQKEKWVLSREEGPCGPSEPTEEEEKVWSQRL